MGPNYSMVSVMIYELGAIELQRTLVLFILMRSIDYFQWVFFRSGWMSRHFDFYIFLVTIFNVWTCFIFWLIFELLMLLIILMLQHQEQLPSGWLHFSSSQQSTILVDNAKPSTHIQNLWWLQFFKDVLNR